LNKLNKLNKLKKNGNIALRTLDITSINFAQNETCLQEKSQDDGHSVKNHIKGILALKDFHNFQTLITIDFNRIFVIIGRKYKLVVI